MANRVAAGRRRCRRLAPQSRRAAGLAILPCDTHTPTHTRLTHLQESYTVGGRRGRRWVPKSRGQLERNSCATASSSGIHTFHTFQHRRCGFVDVGGNQQHFVLLLLGDDQLFPLALLATVLRIPLRTKCQPEDCNRVFDREHVLTLERKSRYK